VSFQSLGRRTGLHRHGGGRIGSIVVTRSSRALVGFFMRGHCKITDVIVGIALIH